MNTTTNTFEGGLNKDTDPIRVSLNQYVEANDVSIMVNGSYGNLKPIKGSLDIQSILSGLQYGISDSTFERLPFNEFINVMAVAECSVIKNSEAVNGICVFISRAESLTHNIPLDTIQRASNIDLFEIYLGGLNNDNTMSFFQKVYSKSMDGGDYLKSTVHYEVSNERGVDNIYYTNQVDPPSRVRCTVDEFGTFPLFRDEDVSLIKTHNVAPPVASSSTGGNLKAGTYQFCSRMFNSVSGLYSKWSLLSNPISIADKAEKKTLDSGNNTPSGSVGETSDKKITLTIPFNNETHSRFNYYQLAVVKNNTGTGVSKLIASTIEPKSKNIITPSETYVYRGDEEETEIDIGDIVIDEAQIEHSKTVTIKNNFLLLGNIKYSDLSYDNGTPTISSGQNNIVSTDFNPGSSGDLNEESISGSYNSNGYYFRDEVYRFGICYHDEHGNFAPPEIFDFSSSVDNEAEAGCIDWKTPDLTAEGLTSASDSELRALRITLNDIQNHPSWAKGFAIVRAKRVRNIQFQSPIVPTQVVQPMIATTVYPQGGFTPNTEAQPPSNSLGTLVPKNFRTGVPKHILRGNRHCQYYYGYDSRVSTQSPAFDAPQALDIDDRRDVSSGGSKYVNILFPPNNIYSYGSQNYNSYSHSESDLIEIVDIQRLHGNEYQISEDEKGISFASSSSQLVSNYVTDLRDNYTNSTKGNIPLRDLAFIDNGLNTKNNVLEYKEVESGSSEATIFSSVDDLHTSSFGDHEGLRSNELLEGFVPLNQKMSLVVTSSGLVDSAYKFFDSIASLNINTTGSSEWEALPGFTNPLLAARIDWNDQLAPNPAHHNYPIVSNSFAEDAIVSIVNITKGLSDFRYGSKNDKHEFIFTGTYVPLSQSDIDNNTLKTVTITGGDCYYDMHTFKVTDSTYFIPSDTISDFPGLPTNVVNVTQFWSDNVGNSFRASDAGTYEVGRPIPIKAHDQRISVLLESEIQAKYTAKKIQGGFKLITTPTGGHTIPAAESLSDAKTPFIYNYNLDYSIPNNNKIFTPKLELTDNIVDFNSRIQYSSERIYQSNELGFDKFKVGNIYDLDESRGKISKLINAKDSVYSVQEDGISYIPVKGQIIETTDSIGLSIRSSDTIGIPQYISTTYGSSYDRTIVNSYDGFCFVDVVNKKVLNVVGREIAVISDINMSSFFDEKLAYYSGINRYLSGVYDFNKREYLLLSQSYNGTNSNPWMINFSELSKSWVSNFSTGDLFETINGSYAWGDVLMVGKFSNDSVGIHKMYSEEVNRVIFGMNSSPSVSFHVNENPLIPKTFDQINVNSEPILDSISVNSFNTYGSEIQSTGMNIAVGDKREGTYRIPILRDSIGRRIRGTSCRIDLDWDGTSSSRASLFALTTTYRVSNRNI